MGDTGWGDVLMFVALQAVPLLVWWRLRGRPRPTAEVPVVVEVAAVVAPAAAVAPAAQVISMSAYVVEREEFERVLSHS